MAGCNPFTIQIADDKLWEGEEPEVTVTDENVAGDVTVTRCEPLMRKPHTTSCISQQYGRV